MSSPSRFELRCMEAGRVELPWLLAVLCASALLAVVFLGWWPARVRLTMAEARGASPAPVATDAPSLASAIENLDQRLARIESALAVQESRGMREPASPVAASDGQPALLASTPEGLDEIHRDLLQMSKRIDLLAGSLKEGHKPAYLLPTLEQIHAARRDVDWAFVNQVRQLCAIDRDAARARVRFMTFDDVLRKIGLPNSINFDDGRWNYIRSQMAENGQLAQQGITLIFVGDTASSVGSFP